LRGWLFFSLERSPRAVGGEGSAVEAGDDDAEKGQFDGTAHGYASYIGVVKYQNKVTPYISPK